MRATGNSGRRLPVGLRIGLTDKDIHELYQIHGTASVRDLAKRTGLPYLKVYNVVRRRVQTVNSHHYRRLFGKPARPQAPLKVDGARFRALARLWLYLNEGVTRTDLYQELYPHHPRSKTDHRIFSGKIRRVDARLEHSLQAKFTRQGVDGRLLDTWLAEFEARPRPARIPYGQIRPALVYLEATLGLNPSSLLNRPVGRYESGELKHVSRRIMEKAAALKASTQQALSGRCRKAPEKLRESLLGGRTGYTLYSDIREELNFLRHYGGKSAREYLGRSTWIYERGNARRIVTWRARKILADCNRFIQEHPDMPLASLPPAQREILGKRLIAVLKARASDLLSAGGGLALERQILKPRPARDGHVRPTRNFTPFDRAPDALGMQPRAFDLMVARHSDIFRSIGKFDKRWYLPDTYLQSLVMQKAFGLVAAKYEAAVRKLRRAESTAADHENRLDEK